MESEFSISLSMRAGHLHRSQPWGQDDSRRRTELRLGVDLPDAQTSVPEGVSKHSTGASSAA